MTFVATGVQALKSDDADKIMRCPAAAVTVTDELMVVFWNVRNGFGSSTRPRRIPLPKLVTQTSFGL